MTTTKTRPEDSPEFKAFLRARAALEEFIKPIADIFEEMQPLVDEYNRALEAAGKVVAATGEECGPFKVHRRSTHYNADALFEGVGEKKFLELGGNIITKQELVISDKEKLMRAIAMNKIEEDLASIVVQKRTAYKRVESICLAFPGTGTK